MPVAPRLPLLEAPPPAIVGALVALANGHGRRPRGPLKGQTHENFDGRGISGRLGNRRLSRRRAQERDSARLVARASDQVLLAFLLFRKLERLQAEVDEQKALSRSVPEASFNTYTWYQASMRGVKDINFDNFEVFQQAHLVAMKHSLDVSDAFQILSIRDGYFSSLVGESATILCTGDAGLATAARAENLNVWNFNTENPPG
jgi:hypothetical protein